MSQQVTLTQYTIRNTQKKQSKKNKPDRVLVSVACV